MTCLRALSCVCLALLLGACAGPTPLMLMSTPVIYHQAAIDPFAHLSPAERVPDVALFYATTRAPEGAGYGNRVSSTLQLGRAQVRLGDQQSDWSQLHSASVSELRARELPLSLIAAQQTAVLPVQRPIDVPLAPPVQSYVDAINLALDKARDKEIIIYVHGAKVDFANACELTGELVHFAGRDFVGLAFDWPSHQNIASYLLGIDVNRARDSSQALAQLIELLARHTAAERINLIAYSAGGRVASLALQTFQNRHPDLNTAQLQARYRIGAVVFAAADVPEEVFEGRLPAISRVAEQVMITVSDQDEALDYAQRLMPGGARIGSSRAEQSLHQFTRRRHLNNVTLLDVSGNSSERGFDIVGHHYWYRHPWVSSDVILLLRTNLPPDQRALSVTEHPAVWYMNTDYPLTVREATRRVLKGQW
jgi:esterase/lipase superfamily enzyme